MIAQHRQGEKRASIRKAVRVPGLVETGNETFTTQVINIDPAGAMLEINGSIRPGSSIFLRCGDIEARALVMWADGNRCGVKFNQSQIPRAVEQQVHRSNALNLRAAGCRGLMVMQNTAVSC